MSEILTLHFPHSILFCFIPKTIFNPYHLATFDLISLPFICAFWKDFSFFFAYSFFHYSLFRSAGHFVFLIVYGVRTICISIVVSHTFVYISTTIKQLRNVYLYVEPLQRIKIHVKKTFHQTKTKTKKNQLCSQLSNKM